MEHYEFNAKNATKAALTLIFVETLIFYAGFKYIVHSIVS